MSELKVYKFLGQDEVWPEANLGSAYYLKSEADKVIAEKDEAIDELEERIDELQKATDSAWSKVNVMYDELCHHKYKRCLAMAKWCIVEAKVSDDEYRMYWWVKWHKRWLKIAEKFKPNKEGQ